MADDLNPKWVPLNLDTLADDRGVTLLDEAGKHFNKVEEAIQQHLEDHLGEPPNKPYEITIKVTVLAEGEEIRRVGWMVESKHPKMVATHLQHARASEGGVLLTRRRPSVNMTLPLERGKKAETDAPAGAEDDEE